MDAGDSYSNQPAPSVRHVLGYISNLVARHEIAFGQLKRLYNNEVSRYGKAGEFLPLFEDADKEDGRKSANKDRLFHQTRRRR